MGGNRNQSILSDQGGFSTLRSAGTILGCDLGGPVFGVQFEPV